MTTFAAERFATAAPARSLELGDLTISYLPDGAVQLHPTGFLPSSSDADWAAHPEYLDESGYLVASVGSLLVRRGDRAILIDAGFGPITLEPSEGLPIGTGHGGELPDSLATALPSSARLEAVALTHLHSDHVGWIGRGGSDLFAGADFPVTEPEWSARELAGAAPENLDAMAARLRLVGDGDEVFPGVRVLSTPGHTAGHAAYVISSGNHRLIVLGDAMHSSLQIDHPDWKAWPDQDGRRAVASRHQLITELTQPNTIGFGGHFADVQFGEVRPGPDGPTWRPLEP